MDFRWYVGGTQVGRVVNVFDRGNDGWGEYWAGFGAQLVHAGTKYFCRML